MQFCGQHAVCGRLQRNYCHQVLSSWFYFRFNNKEAMELAKINVDKHYAVVGVLEMWWWWWWWWVTLQL